ncbi:hypothetical protein LCGC14_0496840 [marine sediment metagenome]|uniref:Uncharacterized protein n=1 Tax=marine sediment metagenome TaxID=412755 RepID=A0A0F9URX0_9ZZZZ
MRVLKIKKFNNTVQNTIVQAFGISVQISTSGSPKRL